MIAYQVHELLLPDGSSPYAKWFMRLDPQAAAKVTVAKLRLQQGNLSNVKWLRGIGEYRIDWGPDTASILLGKVNISFCCWVAEQKRDNRQISTRHLNFGKNTNSVRRHLKLGDEKWH